MLERIKYINSKNQVIETGVGYFVINENDLRNYSWNYETSNNRIVSFNKDGIKEKTIEGYIYAGSEEKGVQIKNEIFNIFEYDVINESHGRLYIGDYYLNCYIIGSEKSEYLKRKRLLKIKLNIVSDSNNWILEKKYQFLKNDVQVSNDSLDYPYDYPYDYANGNINQLIDNTTLMSGNFELVIYGPCSNPAIFIDTHEYNVNVDLFENERLVVDSINKKIYIVKKNGDVVNAFNNRNHDSYIFEMIKSGSHHIRYSGLFNFELTLYAERSEPEWT